MAHYCICPKCKIKFDRDKIQAVRVGARRYGHAACYPDNQDFVPLVYSLENDPEYIELNNYIVKLLGEKNINYALIKKQIKEYKNSG